MNRIAISGPIGVGKTTLVAMLAEKYKLPKYEEPMDVELLEFFYKAQSGHVFHNDEGKVIPLSHVEKLSQMRFLYDNLIRDMKSILDVRGGIYDRTLVEHLHIFAKANLSRFEYYAFCGCQYNNFSLFDIIPKYDLVIILKADISTIKARIAKRDRTAESGIKDEYLERLNGLYNHEDFILDSEMFSDKVVCLDVSEMDAEEVFNEAVRMIDKLNMTVKTQEVMRS
jgi:deoxyadenosine/deoxycytidine kinase